MSNRAVVLCGGQGARLRPYTLVLPKPLMPIGDRPILEIIVRQLSNNGFDHITLAVNYHAALIKAFFEDGARWGVRIDYSLETKPLSTIAPLRLIADLPEHFLLMNGDVLTDLSLGGFFEDHRSANRLFSIAAAERTHTVDYGVLYDGDGGGLLADFKEKPSMHYLVSMGVYAVNRDVLAGIPPDQKYGFDDLMYDCLRNRRPVHIHRHQGYWLDIGRPDDYRKAMEDYDGLKGSLLPDD
jgi:NDP-mannose synthase